VPGTKTPRTNAGILVHFELGEISQMGWIVILVIALIVFAVWLIRRRKPSQDTPDQIARVKVERKTPTTDDRTAGLLLLAYRKRLRITMEYETGNPMPEESARKVRDVDIYGLGNGYFDAYCHYRKAQRTFKLSRVLWVRICDQIYQVPSDYAPTGWVREGEGEVAEGTLDQPIETELPSTPHTTTERGDRPPRKASRCRQSSEAAKSYVHYDWERIFENSIRTPFSDELSPASPYLYEAYRLERDGADQQRIQELIEKAREVDSNATALYLARWSIMKRRRRQTGQLE
jgi:hypothetical protein